MPPRGVGWVDTQTQHAQRGARPSNGSRLPEHAAAPPAAPAGRGPLGAGRRCGGSAPPPQPPPSAQSCCRAPPWHPPRARRSRTHRPPPPFPLHRSAFLPEWPPPAPRVLPPTPLPPAHVAAGSRCRRGGGADADLCMHGHFPAVAARALPRLLMPGERRTPRRHERCTMAVKAVVTSPYRRCCKPALPFAPQRESATVNWWMRTGAGPAGRAGNALAMTILTGQARVPWHVRPAMPHRTTDHSPVVFHPRTHPVGRARAFKACMPPLNVCFCGGAGFCIL